MLCDPRQHARVVFLQLMASGMKLSSTVIHLPENGAGDRCDGEDFERGLGITLQKLDNAPASAAVSFVQLLLVRPRLFSAPAPIFQLCASAEVVFALDHSEDFAVEGNECSAFIGPDALRRASGLSAECLSRVTHLNVLAVHSSSSVGPVGYGNFSKYRLEHFLPLLLPPAPLSRARVSCGIALPRTHAYWVLIDACDSILLDQPRTSCARAPGSRCTTTPPVRCRSSPRHEPCLCPG